VAKTNEPILFDGAMGSLLIDAGLNSSEIPETWNISNPSYIQEIHNSYFKAGSTVVTTNTFGATPLKLETKDMANTTNQYNIAAVDLAKTIQPKNGFIAGDVGPTGKFLPPVGNVTVDEYFNSFKTQVDALISSKVDLILIETMYDVREAIEAVKAVRSIDISIPIIATMTFEKRKRGYFTIMGDHPEKSILKLEETGANIVGVNCTLDSHEMLDLSQEILQYTSLPILVQPNAGQPDVIDGTVTYPQTAKEFADDILEMIENGIRLVGGCCGTTPEFIQEISRRI
jgi:5-methyltetrahydrofolate--homocysteine methyltransferase